jgi:hypothetical protein
MESGMAFPVTVGGFRRVTILHEAVDQLEAGAEYTLAIPQGTLLGRVYIYPAVVVPAVGSPPGTLPQGSASLVQKDFETHKLALIQSHPGIQSVFESQVATTLWDYPRNGKLTSFEYQDPTTGQALRKDLWVYPSFSGRWAIKYLFTYPKEHNAAPEIAAFQRGVPLNVPSEFGPVMITTTDNSCEILKNEKLKVYGFLPSQFSDQERNIKSGQMDRFWKMVKAQGEPGVACLKGMIDTEQQDKFFVFDGTSLLLTLDQSPASLQQALAAMSRSDLTNLDSSGYVRVALFLLNRGLDITPLAEHYMLSPDVKGYVPQHAMRLDRETGALFLYGGLAGPTADQSLIHMLNAPLTEARHTATLLLALSMTEESYYALKSVQKESLPDRVRKVVEHSIKMEGARKAGTAATTTRGEVLQTLRRIPHYGEDFFGVAGDKEFAKNAGALLTAEDVPLLQEARRKSISSLSDEALHEYFALSWILLDVINRHDLYSDVREH